jgi:uncharacterized protein (AIM24 family)
MTPFTEARKLMGGDPRVGSADDATRGFKNKSNSGAALDPWEDTLSLWRMTVDGVVQDGELETGELARRLPSLQGREVFVWREGMADWVPPGTLPDFQARKAPPEAQTPTSPLSRLVCEWCQSQNPVGEQTCRSCGAPLDIKNLVSDSGWREAPRLRDMTEIHFGGSTCQVEGEIVPVAEMSLAPGESVFFEHHVLLWKEPGVTLSVLSLQGSVRRALAGMPFVVTIATGPGRIAFSRDATGEVVVLPLHPGMELDVREHAFLLSSSQIDYSYVRIKGLQNILFGGQGMFMDRFVTTGQPGLLLLHGYGNVFERRLGAGEAIHIEPGAFLYKDSSVTMDVEMQQLTTGFFGGTGMALARVTGPGRVGIQSMYVHHKTD